MSSFLTGARVVAPRWNLVNLVVRSLSSQQHCVTKVGRETYVKTYPTTLVLPDGATITVRYNLPRQIIKLPLDSLTCSESDLKRVQELRRPREKMESFEHFDTTFDPMKYVKQ